MTKNGKIIGDQDKNNDTCYFYNGHDWDNEGTGCGCYAIANKFPHDENKSYWENLP